MELNYIFLIMEDFWIHFISFNWGEHLRNIVAVGGVAALIYGISRGILILYIKEKTNVKSNLIQLFRN